MYQGGVDHTTQTTFLGAELQQEAQQQQQEDKQQQTTNSNQRYNRNMSI